MKIEGLNTVIVPAKEEGFKNEFLKNNRWFSLRISIQMLDKLKYITIYRVSPISAITHYAEIDSFEKWNGTDRYVAYLKGPVKEINPLKLSKGKKGGAPQSSKYTSISKLLEAKTLSEIFKP